MIKKLLPSRRGRSRRPSTIPDGQRVYAVGDIHGRLDLLEDLLGRIFADDAARDIASTQLIFLGDLVDRGPDSAGVVARLRSLNVERPGTRFLTGNHEEVLLLSLAGDLRALRLFCRIGGRETTLSYGIPEGEYEALDYQALAERLRAAVPDADRDFLESFEDVVVVGDYAFVHAGVRPGLPLDAQRTEDLRWIRDTFLSHRGPFEKVIVHGHTITEEAELQPHRIGIDTGAFVSGRLTALGLEGTERWLLQT